MRVRADTRRLGVNNETPEVQKWIEADDVWGW